ncbi:MAG: hypothetical protein JXA41_13630 [Deltaproteobacteria bacterium]|nr:hypothetical protein [Deltaproteobacteria bacterium]
MDMDTVPFYIKDCTLLIKMSGFSPAFDIRDLRERIAQCSPSVIYHHYFENLLAPTFDYPDFRNDFAVWVKRQLDDDVLAERLGMIEPYRFDSLEDLRTHTLDIIDERLSELHFITAVPPGHEFYFQEAITVVFETGHVMNNPGEMFKIMPQLTSSSIYYHFLEARRRTPDLTDDFSLWLENFGSEWEPLIRDLRSIDFIFYSLPELKEELLYIMQQYEVKE